MSGPGGGLSIDIGDIGAAFALPSDLTAFQQPVTTGTTPVAAPTTAFPRAAEPHPPPPDMNVIDTNRQIEAGRKLGGELQPTDFRGRFP